MNVLFQLAGYTAGILFFCVQIVHAASFDCAKASTTVEKAICSNAELSALDDRLSAAYKAALTDTLDPASVKTSQREWVKARNACKTVSCLQEAYRGRIAALGNGGIPETEAIRTITWTITPPGQSHGNIEVDDDVFLFEMGSSVADKIFDACKIDDVCRIEAVVIDEDMIVKVLSVTRVAVAEPQNGTTAEFWVQRSAQERKDEVILGLCINETDDCGTMVIKKGSQPFSVYQQNRSLFKTGLIFRATFDKNREITQIHAPFPLP